MAAPDERRSNWRGWWNWPPPAPVPGFVDIWSGEYPTGRGRTLSPEPWTCPTCGRGLAGWVRSCDHGEAAKAAPAFIGKELGDWGQDDEP